MICQICGTEFDRTSNSQKYCPDCGKEMRDEQRRVWFIKNAEYRRAYEHNYYIEHKENHHD